MNFLVIHERGNCSAIRQAKSIEEAKKELLKMVQEAAIECSDVFRICKGTKSRAAAKQGSFGHDEKAEQAASRASPATKVNWLIHRPRRGRS